ncbi:hypothetical protein ACEQ8H_000842 [Pleosporales sp. CAS-2024a]
MEQFRVAQQYIRTAQDLNQQIAQEHAARFENTQLEIEASIARLNAMADAMCASTRDRLTRRVNRIPANLRNARLVDILMPKQEAAPIAKPIVAQAPATQDARVKAAPKKAAVTKKAAAPTATRKPRAAPAKVTKPVTQFSTSPVPSRHTATRAKKRASDEMSSENKENSPVSVVNKKARTAVTKPAPATRATRAASRQQAAQILSPKNNNPRQKAKPTTRPR